MSRDFNKYFFEQVRYTGYEPSYSDWVDHMTNETDKDKDEPEKTDEPGSR